VSESHKNFRVLVVDDESTIAVTLAVILQKSGYDAAPFTDPLAALFSARENPPGLLITDVVMPELSGIDLAIRIKEEFPACKILLFSGQAATANLLEEAAAKGYEFDLITKPIHPADLLRKISLVTA
jgi:CheY-like chemotaxis protein